ncbi:MAG: TrmB family transcriptional regulator [Candidatus Micrarchaeia archaeon]
MLEEKTKVLKDLGFSDSEIKLYLKLLSLGKADSKTLSKETKILLPRIYPIAEKLAEKGFIRILPGHPSMFEVIPPFEAFSSFLERMESKKREVESLVIDFQKIFYERKQEEEEILIYKDFNTIKKEIINVDKFSKKEVDIYSRFVTRDEEILENLEKLVKRKVKVKVIGAVRDQRSELIAYSYKNIGCEVKILGEEDYAPLSFSINDGNVLFLLFESEKNPNNYLNLTLKNRKIVQMFSNLFNYYWEKGKII